LREEHPAYCLRAISLPPEFVRPLAQPPPDAVRLDVLEAFAVHTRGPAVGSAASIGVVQHVLAVHLVVQQVEPVAGRFLRFGAQRLLKLPSLLWRLQAHATLLTLCLAASSLN